jgi:signal peptidase I
VEILEAVKQENKKRPSFIWEIIETVALTALLFFLINLAIQNYDVSGPSMEPTLHNQERIMVDKVTYLFRSPERGDIIVFVAPPQPSYDYVKRIIGVPGDVITIVGTTVKVNGTTLNEPYVKPQYNGNPYPPIINRVVPAGDYFVLGDDRADSSDSRDWGFVPRKNIIGRAALVYWPLNESNSGFLPNVSAVFAHVHQHPQQSMQKTTSSTGTFGTDDMVICTMPGAFLLSSRYRKKYPKKSSNMLRCM